MESAGEVEISTDPARFDLDGSTSFSRAPTGRRNPARTLERAITGSFCFGAFARTRSAARVITDKATFAMSQTFVLEEFQVGASR
jgi:hypothetical protein